LVFIARQCNRLALSQVLWVIGLRAHADIGQLRGKLKRSVAWNWALRIQNGWRAPARQADLTGVLTETELYRAMILTDFIVY